MYAETLDPSMRGLLAAWTLPPARRKAILAGAELRIEGLIAAGYLSRFPNGALYLADGGTLVLGPKMRATLEELAMVMRAKGEPLPAAAGPRIAAPAAPLEGGGYRAECMRLRATVARLEEELRSVGSARPRASRPKASAADPFSTPARALVAWYAAAGPDAFHLPGWRKTVMDDHGRLSPEAFGAAMLERVEGTRALAASSAAYLAAGEAATGKGSGTYYWHPRLRCYVRAPARGEARDAFEREVRAQYQEARRARILGERRAGQRARAEKRRIAKAAAEDVGACPRHAPIAFRIRHALEASRAARKASHFPRTRKRPRANTRPRKRRSHLKLVS